jgi:hypothetical protein
MGTIILSALVAHTGWHWMLERADRLRQFPFEWPAISAALLAGAARALLLVAVAAAGYWAWGVVRQRSHASFSAEPANPTALPSDETGT